MAPSISNVRSGFKFNLSNIESALKLLDNASKEKVCVVSFIGKTSLREESTKATLIDEVLGSHILKPEVGSDDPCDDDVHIGGYYHQEGQVIFLYLCGVYDSGILVNACKTAEQDLKEKSFLEVWCDMQCTVAKAILFLFHVSHVITIVHPTAAFDVSYVHLFRTLDSIRQKSISCLSDLLQTLPISSEWIQAARPCSPRVLFVFLTCPLDGSPAELVETGSKLRSKKLPPIKKLEHSLEDQIYHILRKSRVITNISGNSLFAVPANQEFVYVVTSNSVAEDPTEFFLSQIQMVCSLNSETDTFPSPFSTSFDYSYTGDSKKATGPNSFEHNFPSFLWQHIDLALTKGFDDNVGRHPVPAYFELPIAPVWFKIASKLTDWFFGDVKGSKNQSILSNLKTALDIDVRFSEGRCGKVLPIASAAYQENLPSHYTAEYHQRKLAHAIQVFTMHARGPAFHRYGQQLREDCEKLWKSGHQMCELLSLTGNHCINPLHRVPDTPSDESMKSFPIMPHCSQVKLVSACDCGRTQSNRDDPFNIKAANYDFYLLSSAKCCGELERIDFPIFEPSSSDPRPAVISVSSKPSVRSVESKSQASDSSSNLSLGFSVNTESSSGSVESDAKDAKEATPVSSDEKSVESKDKAPVKQQQQQQPLQTPSKTEYLPGMLHSQSPPGLLPRYSSWSLVCLGPSSLYSHNIGIQDQPGFLSGTNFLLPWDVAVKIDNKDRWPALWEGKRVHNWKGKKTGKDGLQFTVKVFIGVEYECPRGHRFMCSAPDRILRATNSGLVKDNANKVANSNMPLYFPCLCRYVDAKNPPFNSGNLRSAKPQIAQLMRIHVVTPKAPVHVTLSPRVQPAPPPAPVFIPGNKEPVKLSQSAYWVLRLPFVYEGNSGPYLPPKEPVPVEAARLLSGTYGIVEQTLER